MHAPASMDLIQDSLTLNRYLLKIYNQELDADVISFTATEALNKPYRYNIRFTCPQQNISINNILNAYASFYMRAPALQYMRGSPQKWQQLRQINGVITHFSRLGSSPDEAVYECVLEHELALLDRTRKCAVYLNVSVPELVKQVLLEHPEFEPYKIDFDGLHHRYPVRKMVIQWQESDLAFVQRLLAEVGIGYRFENHAQAQSEVVIKFSDTGGGYVYSDKKPLYVRNSGQTSAAEYVTDLQEFYSVIARSSYSRNYNYETSSSPGAEKSLYLHDVPENISHGREYHYADNQRTEGDFYGDDAESATFNARIRQEYLHNSQRRLHCVTNDPQLTPGTVFEPQGNISDGFKQGVVITSMEVSGSRSEHYLAKLTGIPKSDSYTFRPQRLPRPVIAGTVPARVSTREKNGLYASTDAQGRYIVKFDFDMQKKEKGYESAYIRLGRPYAGDVYGFHFPLLDNTEVAIAFEGGDPDRPFISHVLHDALNKDLVTLRNDTRNVIRTPSLNKIRLEDRRGEEHVKVATEYGKSQLSAGHLVNADNKQRGAGVEVRTDEWGAVRAAKGLLLTTEPQPRAQGQQLDMAAAIASLQSALTLAMTLQQCARTAGAESVDTASQEQLKATLDRLKAPGLLAFADKGQAFATPSTLQLSAGEDLVATAGKNASVNVLKKFSLAVGEKLALFARKMGIQLIAGAGNVEAQAQRGEMHLLSEQDFTLMSTAGKMSGSAKQGIQLVCGGGGIRINADGSVEIFSPTAIELKSANLAVKGPESVKTTAPAFDTGKFKRRFRVLSPDDPDQFLPEQKFRLTSSTGKITEGMTDKEGYSSLLDGDDIETFKMELIND